VDGSGPVTVSFTLTRSDVLGTCRRLVLKQRRWWLLPAAGASLMLGGFASTDTGVLVAGGALLAWWGWCCFLAVPRSTWQRCEHGLQRFEFDADGVTGTLPNASSRFDWDYWSEVIATKSTYVLRTQHGNVVIPRSAFSTPEDETTFGRLAATKIALVG
jgi:YcxB-like protein